MRCLNGTLISLLLIPLTLISWYRAYNLYIEANSSLYRSEAKGSKQDDTLFPGPGSQQNKQKLNIPKFDNLTVDDKLDNVFYFVQVSIYLLWSEIILFCNFFFQTFSSSFLFFLLTLRYPICIYQNSVKLVVLHIFCISLELYFQWYLPHLFWLLAI